MSSSNPWGDLKEKALGIVPPVVILREQATLLTDATEGLVQGEVTSHVSDGGMSHQLRAVVPTLNSYTVILAYVTHGQQLYPTSLDAPDRRDPPLKCADKDEFRIEVIKLLSRPQTQQLVAGLLAQASGEM